MAAPKLDVIIGAMGKHGEDDEEGDELDAAKDLIEAVHAKDPHAVNLALQRHYEACEDKHEEPDEDDEEEEPSSERY